jgi:phage minor structural protein
MIQIYRKGNTNYTKNGDAVLFPTECRLKAKLNDTWEMELIHPVDQDARWKYIGEEAVIAAPTFQGKKQLFRIDKVSKDDNEITAVAYPVFFDSMDDCFLLDMRPTAKNGQEALDIMTAGSEYSGQSDIKKISTAYFVRRNLMSAINGEEDPSFVSRWGGEILFDNHTIIINERVGGNYGMEIRYGKNMSGIDYQVDMADVVTRIIPVAYNGYMLDGDFPWVDSPNIEKYAKIYTREVKFDDVKIKEDASEDEVSYDTLADLRAELRKRCNELYSGGVDLPKVTIKIDVVDLSECEEYEEYADIERIGLGDTVKCYNLRLDITTEARAIEIEWDCIRDVVGEIVLGDFEYNYFSELSSTLNALDAATNRINRVVRGDGSVIASAVKGFLDAAKTQLWYQKNVAQRQDVRAILFEDLDPSSPLYGAMALGTQGLQISKKRTADGRDWRWSTALTANGLIANIIVAGILSDKEGLNYWDLDTGEFSLSATGFRIDGKEAKKYFQDSWSQEDVLNKLTNNGVNKGIYMLNGELYMNATYVRTGQLSADRVYGGTLTLGGRNNANGKLSIRDASNTEIGRWDNSGIYINGGEIYSRTDKSEASIRGGNIHVSHSGTNIGHIGTREFNEAPESKGIMFGIESTAYYLTWAARSRSTETTYPVKMLYANKTFSDYEAGKLYVSCNTDFKGYEIQNAYINGLRVRKSFSIPNNIACDIYSDMDFHSWTLKNITVSNLSAVNGYTTVNGSLRVVTDVDITSNGGVTCEYATIRARDGIITILE